MPESPNELNARILAIEAVLSLLVREVGIPSGASERFDTLLAEIVDMPDRPEWSRRDRMLFIQKADDAFRSITGGSLI